MDCQSTICDYLIKIIRDSSETGQIIRGQDILMELQDKHLVEPEDIESKNHWDSVLAQVVEENPDLKIISGADGTSYFFSTESMTETYAGILVRKSESSLLLIAEVVRENSRVYPRPVRLDGFRERPFDLTREEIAECLLVMRKQKEYKDIAQVVTSIGTQFLYSTLHLEPDHALTLAEWLDVGQADNP